jgi:hypothetical protein
MNPSNRRTDCRGTPRGKLGPDWRRQVAAQHLLLPGLGRLSLFDDPVLRDLSSYLAQHMAGTEQAVLAERRFPNIVAAERLNTDPNAVAKLKLMVVGNLP